MAINTPKHIGTGLMPRVKSIIKIEPYKAVILWSTGEIKVADFKRHFIDKSPFFQVLADYSHFSRMEVADTRTIYWAHLDLQADPDVLYDISEPLDSFELRRVSKDRLKQLSGKKK